MPKSQNNMNQQNTILPFCKSVKFLYSGVKKLYTEHVFLTRRRHNEYET